jgi:hypothetical protein
MFTAGSTLIRRVRMRSRGDTLPFRRRIESVLNDASLHPSSLPETAILCVRKLSSVLRINPANSRLQTSSQYQSQLSGTMDDLARQAVRPWQSGFTSEAPAVLFLDHAEMLACFAFDWLNGDLSARWWWRALFPDGDWPVLLQRVWMENPRHVPAAMNLLDQKQRCATFLSALPDEFRTQLGAAVVRVYAVEESHTALGALLQQFETNRPKGAASPLNSHAEEVFEQHRAWERYVAPESSLHHEAERIRVLCLLLVRAPALARNLHLIEPARTSQSLGPKRTGASDLVIAHLPRQLKPPRTGSPRAPRKKSLSTIKQVKSGLACVASVQNSSQTGELSKANSRAPADTMRASHDLRAAPQPFRPLATIESTSYHTWHTRYAGIFYLINVAFALGLYSDFTRPRSPSLPLPLWDFVALMGKKFLGSEFETDPLWDALAQLATRLPAEPPGAYFQPPPIWRVPSAWLDVFPQKSGWRGGIQNGLVRLEHPSGFTALERPLANNEDESVALENECATFGISAQQLFPAAFDQSSDESPLDRWQNLLASYLQARLGVTFRKFNSELLELLFINDATIIVDTENVVIRFALVKHPIAVRMAGLDRDPGWIPAAGRVVRFEYQ